MKSVPDFVVVVAVVELEIVAARGEAGGAGIGVSVGCGVAIVSHGLELGPELPPARLRAPGQSVHSHIPRQNRL